MIHLYAQEQWHADAKIIATYDDLRALRDTIDVALVRGYAEMKAFTNDGEGYDLKVMYKYEEEFYELPVPYKRDEVK